MSIFDNVKGAFNNAEQKGKNASLISKHRKNITMWTEECQRLFAEIGEQYYKAHKNDCEDAYKLIISEIVDYENRINRANEKIDTLKGIVRCQNCGQEVPQGANFCLACGAKIETKQQNEIPDDIILEEYSPSDDDAPSA